MDLIGDNHRDKEALGRFIDGLTGEKSGECKEVEMKCYTEFESKVLHYGLQHFQFMRRLTRHETLCTLAD